MINGRAATMMAQDEGINVLHLPMYDDISAAPPERRQDRRGAPGTIFIYKILGAAAEEGMPLQELLALGEAVRERIVTLAAAVAPGVSPLTGKPMFSLPEDEIFLGMGVHGEPGVGRVKVGPVNELVEMMVDKLLADRPIASGGTGLCHCQWYGRHHIDGAIHHLVRDSRRTDASWYHSPRAIDRQLCHYARDGWFFDLSDGADSMLVGLLVRGFRYAFFPDQPSRSIGCTR